jgi:predicted Fe-S protein YdhL (DUF1289 family)
MTQLLNCASAAPLASPCVNVCALDDNGVCQGCFRTLAEISAWRESTESEKAETLAKSKARQDALFL